MARRVLDPYAAKVLKSGGLPEKVRMLEALARVEPERVLELAEKECHATLGFAAKLRHEVLPLAGLMSPGLGATQSDS
jgi:hypothetical protein